MMATLSSIAWMLIVMMMLSLILRPLATPLPMSRKHCARMPWTTMAILSSIVMTAIAVLMPAVSQPQ
jgi:hypothetical protein